MFLLQDNPIGDMMNNTEWAFPMAECFHIVGFAIAIGTITMVDLRMLGIGMKRQTSGQLVKDTEIWTIVGLFLVLISGPMILLSDPNMYFNNQSFRFKIGALLVAILYNYTIHRMVAKKNLEGAASVLAGGVSVALWASVIFAGIFIAFV